MTQALLRQTAIAIYEATRMLPVGAVAGQQGHYVFTDFVVTPFLNVIKLKPYQTPAKSFMTDKLATDIKLATALDVSEQVVIDVHKGFITIQIPRPKSERGQTVYTSANVPRGTGLRVSLGLDVFNEPVHFDFGQHMNTNLSFLGVPGSGKSVSMRRSIVSLAKNNDPDRVKFLMIEVAKDALDLRMFSRLPHLMHPVISNPLEAEHALNWLVVKIKEGPLPFKLVLCVDEVAELIGQQPDTTRLLASLIATGRAVNVVNLLATQITDRDTLGREGRAVFRQIHNTILGKASNKQLSYVLGNSGGLRAEALCGEGDLLLRGNDQTARFAGVFTTAADVDQLPRVETVNSLPIGEYTNTEAVKEAVKPVAEIEETPATRICDNFTARQLYEAIFERPAINTLQKHFSMGGEKATRLQKLGADVWQLAVDNGHCFICEDFIELPSTAHSTIPPFDFT